MREVPIRVREREDESDGKWTRSDDVELATEGEDLLLVLLLRLEQMVELLLGPEQWDQARRVLVLGVERERARLH